LCFIAFRIIDTKYAPEEQILNVDLILAHALPSIDSY
jgi:hypothetical protein